MDFTTHIRPTCSRLLFLCAGSALMLPAMSALAASDETGFSTTEPASMLPRGESGYSYLRLSGSTFHPFDSTGEYSYRSSGCIYGTGGEYRFVRGLILPEGAILDSIRFFYYDNSSSAYLSAYFTTYDGSGNFAQTNIGNSSADGYGFIERRINLKNDENVGPMNLTVAFNGDRGSDVAFCGVRVRYTIEISDVIFANGFE